MCGRTQTRMPKSAVNAKAVLQHPRIATLASEVVEDQEAIGRSMYLSQDPAASDTSRFNAGMVSAALNEIEVGPHSGRDQADYRRDMGDDFPAILPAHGSGTGIHTAAKHTAHSGS
jgi:hypothetical protein